MEASEREKRNNTLNCELSAAARNTKNLLAVFVRSKSLNDPRRNARNAKGEKEHARLWISDVKFVTGCVCSIKLNKFKLMMFIKK